jgi:sulfur-carrier protein
LGYLRLRSGSIWPAVLAHASGNVALICAYDAFTVANWFWKGELYLLSTALPLAVLFFVNLLGLCDIGRRADARMMPITCLLLNPDIALWHHLSMPKIHIPTPLRQYAGKQPAVEVRAATVGEALSGLLSQHPELRRHLYTEDGKLRAFVNVYLNDEDVRYLQKDATAVADSDNISIVPSIAGGW